MNYLFTPVPIDGDTPCDRRKESDICQQLWPEQAHAVIVTGCYTRLLCWQQGRLQRLGGSLFPIGDPASLSRLGLWSVQEMLQAVEGIKSLTPLGNALFARFDGSIEQVVDWSKQAQASDYAALSADVLAQPQDPLAIALLMRCADELAALAQAVPASLASRVGLSGALAQACLPYLNREAHA
ncbi:glucosamine kinase [Musicola paradisiaca]|uniref:Uncharacterized protein n=1 Tax=Musicola paradisiaca (strain Ech703) TaxID=579405 RepID=C6CA46_MUSP7|nr:glucosamine kinase [Musicola paradisiaca]ACS84521.1 conserved hypothetical protein [Musicola paradisiaca Ech703]